MRKTLAAVLTLLLCTAFSSCGNSAGEEILLTELIESETEMIEFSETAEASVKTEADSETQTEASDDIITEQTTEVAETEETATEISENNDDLEIADINFSYACPEKDWYKYYAVSARNSRVYVLAWGGSEESKTSFITNKQFAEIAEAVNQSGISKFYGTDNSAEQDSSLLLDVCTATITDVDGKVFSAVQRGDIPEAFTELDKVLSEYAENAYCGEDPSEYTTVGIRKAVDAMVYFKSYLGKLSETGGDCSAYAGQSMIIDSTDLNPLDSDNFYLPDDWDGYAFVKFTADGTDVEYANWSETKEGLFEDRLIYDDLEAYYIENGTIIGATLEE